MQNYMHIFLMKEDSLNAKIKKNKNMKLQTES